ncbi:type I secretion system permease/ATPase [Xanthobacter sp. V4C-4]|uniref:type I secretion system permease/ATPase n=1 Tax=Xanthobacter cornucopiae TaxID=3119924 RepID=UPI0037270BF9
MSPPGPGASPKAQAPTALDAGLGAIHPAFVAVVVFSFFINILALNGPLYMMQVYDRVLASRNLETLVVLTLIAAFLYAVWAALEGLRARLLARAGVAFDTTVNTAVFDAVLRLAARSPGSGQAQPLRDLETVRDFFAGAGIVSLCDVPWVPIYIACATVLHPLYGVLAVASCVFSGVIAVLNNRATRRALEQANRASISANAVATATFRNAEALKAMGMAGPLRERWRKVHDDALGWQGEAGDRGAVLVALTKFNRALVQSVVLGLGAYLAIEREISPGMMIAGSILLGRCIQPIEQAVSNWKSVVQMRSAYDRVQLLLRAAPAPEARLELPEARGEVTAEALFARAPGRDVPVIRNLSFKLPAGAALGIVGPTAAGKSTLARVLVGVWPAAAGSIRLDGSELAHWNEDQLGRQVGYLPQDVELFAGTVAENIARFGPPDDAGVVEAARIAGVHEMIQRLPQGYNTQIGEGGVALSGGQRQRVGLARAVYGLPALVVLDEPNASLDPPGEQALTQAIRTVKEAGRTVIIISHRAAGLGQCDFILGLKDGAQQAFGPREATLAKLAGGAPTVVRARTPLLPTDPLQAGAPPHAASAGRGPMPLPASPPWPRAAAPASPVPAARQEA